MFVLYFNALDYFHLFHMVRICTVILFAIQQDYRRVQYVIDDFRVKIFCRLCLDNNINPSRTMILWNIQDLQQMKIISQSLNTGTTVAIKMTGPDVFNYSYPKSIEYSKWSRHWIVSHEFHKKCPKKLKTIHCHHSHKDDTSILIKSSVSSIERYKNPKQQLPFCSLKPL